MAAVTSSPDPVTGCSVRALGRMRYVAAAAPEFDGRWFGGTLPAGPRGDRARAEEFARAPVVVFDRRDDFQDMFVRRLGGRGAGAWRHHVPTSEGFLDSVVAGLGWGMVPVAQAGGLLRSGALTELAPGRPLDVPLYWQQWKLDSPALAAVARAVVAGAEEVLRGAE
jgi:LysR family transcriptional regulator (chromosome initiation inhibitor)